MTTITATQARNSQHSLLDEVAESHEAIQITGNRRSAVLVSADDWNAIQETLCHSAIPSIQKSIQAGLKTPVRKCAKQLK